MPKPNSTGFIGVTWDKYRKKFKAVFKKKTVSYHITAEGAAIAHDNYARKHGGIKFNFPES
jgi:hypothetical protein